MDYPGNYHDADSYLYSSLHHGLYGDYPNNCFDTRSFDNTERYYGYNNERYWKNINQTSLRHQYQPDYIPMRQSYITTQLSSEECWYNRNVYNNRNRSYRPSANVDPHNEPPPFDYYVQQSERIIKMNNYNYNSSYFSSFRTPDHSFASTSSCNFNTEANFSQGSTTGNIGVESVQTPQLGLNDNDNCTIVGQEKEIEPSNGQSSHCDLKKATPNQLSFVLDTEADLSLKNILRGENDSTELENYSNVRNSQPVPLNNDVSPNQRKPSQKQTNRVKKKIRKNKREKLIQRRELKKIKQMFLKKPEPQITFTSKNEAEKNPSDEIICLDTDSDSDGDAVVEIPVAPHPIFEIASSSDSDEEIDVCSPNPTPSPAPVPVTIPNPREKQYGIENLEVPCDDQSEVFDRHESEEIMQVCHSPRETIGNDLPNIFATPSNKTEPSRKRKIRSESPFSTPDSKSSDDFIQNDIFNTQATSDEFRFNFTLHEEGLECMQKMNDPSTSNKDQINPTKAKELSFPDTYDTESSCSEVADLHFRPSGQVHSPEGTQLIQKRYEEIDLEQFAQLITPKRLSKNDSNLTRSPKACASIENAASTSVVFQGSSDHKVISTNSSLLKKTVDFDETSSSSDESESVLVHENYSNNKQGVAEHERNSAFEEHTTSFDNQSTSPNLNTNLIGQSDNLIEENSQINQNSETIDVSLNVENSLSSNDQLNSDDDCHLVDSQPEYFTVDDNSSDSSSIDVENIDSNLSNNDVILNIHNVHSGSEQIGNKQGQTKTPRKHNGASSNLNVSERRAQEMGMRFECYWTPDRAAFYDRSWGGENYDHDIEQKLMPRNARAWSVPRDKIRRHRDPKDRVRCQNCRQMGHLRRNCPVPVKPCAMCGERSHGIWRCPKSCCLNCFKELHGTFQSSCGRCQRLSNSKCSVCSCYGHHLSTCPDLWRRYHLTTNPDRIIVQPKPNCKYQAKIIWCAGCARRGHSSESCSFYEPLAEFPLSSMNIHSYKNMYQNCYNPPTAKRVKRNYDLWEIHNLEYDVSNQSYNTKDDLQRIPLVLAPSESNLRDCTRSINISQLNITLPPENNSPVNFSSTLTVTRSPIPLNSSFSEVLSRAKASSTPIRKNSEHESVNETKELLQDNTVSNSNNQSYSLSFYKPISLAISKKLPKLEKGITEIANKYSVILNTQVPNRVLVTGDVTANVFAAREKINSFIEENHISTQITYLQISQEFAHFLKQKDNPDRLYSMILKLEKDLDRRLNKDIINNSPKRRLIRKKIQKLKEQLCMCFIRLGGSVKSKTSVRLLRNYCQVKNSKKQVPTNVIRAYKYIFSDHTCSYENLLANYLQHNKSKRN